MYQHKYSKYKLKMINLNNQNGGTDIFNNILFIHNTFGYDNLISILKSGILKLGSKVDEKQRKLSGGIPMDEIYMNIYFKDLKNLPSPCGLIFSSKLLEDYDVTINAGWKGKKFVEIKKNDKKKKNKINKVKKFLKNPKKILSEKLTNILPGIMTHEVLFFEDIPIKDYLIGITDCGYTDKQKKEIQNIIKKNNLNVDFTYDLE
jgi:hypothetical protein